jgi:hypothetical protein
MKAVGHLAGGGRPAARRFGVGLRAVPHDHLDPGLGLQPLRHGRGFPVGEQRQGPPPFQVQEDSAVGMTPPQREIVHAEHLWGTDCRAGSATDHPQQGVPTDGETERLAQPRSSRPPEGQPNGEEACREPQGPPGPRRREAG